MERNSYNPDVLNCLANLSNDEVFTPPAVAVQMLDLLPQELFRSPKTTFLDPFSKSGVFLREIVKRLDRGLQEAIPDRQQRIDHILHHQVFGIAITELTAFLSRRSLYCAKDASSRYSVSHFDTPSGNLLYEPLHHTWGSNDKCIYCGASRAVYDRGDAAEQYAYQFIHTDNPQSLFKNMKFDVIIGNPPYQLSKATEKSTDSNAAFASAIYPMFFDQALKLNPSYLIMITPSRWMTRTGQGISDDWVDKLIKGNHFVEIHDYLDSTECFAGVDIMGGVSYFLYQLSYEGKCRFVSHSGDSTSTVIDYLDSYNSGIIIRDPKARHIVDKIIEVEGDYYNNNTFSSLVGPSHFYDKAGVLNTSWRGYVNKKDNDHSVKYYLNKRVEEKGYAWIKASDIPKNDHTLNRHKVFIPKANGSFGENAPILGIPFYGEPGSVCSQTYIYIGRYEKEKADLSEKECHNIISYIKTKFFRYMVSIKKNTQDAPTAVYQFVPMQDFSHPWTDEMLYKKYGLGQKEIGFIESMIRPME